MNDHGDAGRPGALPDRRQSFALLVDGYVRDLFATGLILQRLDYDVYIASAAEDALRIVEAAAPSLIITELALPQMSGLELLVRIKHDPRTRALPVIIHSSQQDPERMELCRASGCAAFLKKPADPVQLFSAIQQATASTRRYIRLRTLLPVHVGGQLPGGAGTEYVSELSENGIFVRTLTPRPVKAVLPVAIMIHSIAVKVRAAVVYSVPLGPGLFREPGMGMKFEEISATDRELLRNVIKGQIMKDVPAS